MTNLQLRTAIAIQELGSISNASKKLGISQPNASSGLKQLENEIGFPIFERTKTGAILTERGSLFLAHARNILAEQEAIMDIRRHTDIYRLRLGTVNYYSAMEPFLKLCRKHRDEPCSDFRCLNVSIQDGLEALDKHELDIVFAPALKSQLTGVINVCRKKNLSMISLGSVPAVISLRKDHPAVLDGRCKNITQGSDAMKEYPYAGYRNLSDDQTSTCYNDTNFIQSSSIIYVDEVDLRLRLVASTNAFMFGIVPSQGVNDRYGLVSFPVPGFFLELICFARSVDKNRKEIQEYLSLLKKELGL